MSIIIFLIILALLVLVHEFGHFIVAKKSGIRVDEFGLGFPPKIASKKFGSTLYSLNLIPFGGFVKIFGEDQHMEVISEADRHISFYYKPKWIQAGVLVAGVTFNIIFAWLFISLGFMVGLPASSDYSSFGKISDTNTIVTEVLLDSPAAKAGLKPGDRLISISSGNENLNQDNLMPERIQKLISESKEKNIKVVYERNGETPVTTSIEPNTNTVIGKRVIGIRMDRVGTLKLPIHLAFLEGVRTTFFLTKSVIVGLGGFLWKIVTFHSDFSEVSGPVGIASTISKMKTLGFAYLLSLTALISINLAVVNLLPFPALDGGRLFFILIEVIIHKPIPPKLTRWLNTTGFAFLIILMLVITTHDIFKLF